MLCLLQHVDGTGEGGEVVASLPIEEGGVGQAPHVLGLDLRSGEATLDQHPHKEGEEIWREGEGERGVKWRSVRVWSGEVAHHQLPSHSWTSLGS